MLIAHPGDGTHPAPDDEGNTWGVAADPGDTALVLLCVHIICNPGSQAPYGNQISPPASKGFPHCFARCASSSDKEALQHGDPPLLPLATFILFLFLLKKLG